MTTAMLLAALVGLGVGVVVGALGAGGGILAVPILVYLLGQDPHAATASSLVIVGMTALASILFHARRGNVAWRDGLVFAACSTVGTAAGSRLSALVPAAVLMIAFACLLAVVSVAMFRRAAATRREEAARTRRPPGPVQPVPVARSLSGPVLVGTATATGALTGFFGVGGGFIVVPMLVLALGLSMRRAAGTSLLVMLVASAVGLVSRIGTDVHVDWAVTLLFALGSMLGGLAGGPLSERARASTLTLVFASLLGAVAVFTLAETLLG